MATDLSALNELMARFRARDRAPDASGVVTAIMPHAITISGLSVWANLGDFVEIQSDGAICRAEVVSILGQHIVAVPHEGRAAVRLGADAKLAGRPRLMPHASWKGRTIDPLGRPIDNGGALLAGPVRFDFDRPPPSALARQRVARPIHTGIKAIDLFTPLCSGQRIGIFAGSGVGKSTLLAMLAAIECVDTVVVALVGERGREVREFLEDILGPSRRRTVAVVATGDDSAMLRRLAPKAAMCIAEHFRDLGEQVLLVVDSITRFAHAQREYALAGEEPPVARGYPPSVFRDLAKLLERAGPGAETQGAITLVASVLIDGDDHNDPVADAVRGILDGHIVLDRKIAAQGRWPAIDVLGSISRLAPKSWTAEQRVLVDHAKSLIALFEETKDLRSIAGHKPGVDAAIDRAVLLAPKVLALIKQPPDIRAPNCFADLEAILANTAAAPTVAPKTSA